MEIGQLSGLYKKFTNQPVGLTTRFSSPVLKNDAVQLGPSLPSFSGQSYRSSKILNHLSSLLKNGELGQPADMTGPATKTISLSVQTKEGDLVTINLKVPNSAEAEAGDVAGYAIEVKGDLSQEEKDALADLMRDIGSLTDRFFSADSSVDFSFLRSFKTGTLESLSLNARGEMGQSFAVNYAVDYDAQKQSLDVNYKNLTDTAKFGITAGFGQSSAEGLNDYEGIIKEAVQQAYQGGIRKNGRSIAAMFQSGFSSVMELAGAFAETTKKTSQYFNNAQQLAAQLFRETAFNDPRFQGLDNEKQVRLRQGISEVVDFTARFMTNEGGTAKRAYSNEMVTPEVNHGLTLSLSQETSVNEATKEFTQKRGYSLQSAYVGEMKTDVLAEKELYSVKVGKNAGINKIDQTRDREVDNFLKKYLGNGESLRKVEQFAERADNVAIVSTQAFLEMNSLERKGEIFNGITAGQTLLWGKNNDVSTRQSQLRFSFNI